MAPDVRDEAVDAITEEELTARPLPRDNHQAPALSESPPHKKPKNAFSELLARPTDIHKRQEERNTKANHKPPQTSSRATAPPDPTTGRNLNATHGRDALGAYTAHPESFPSPSRVIYHGVDFVAVRDVFPKASVHTLLLPRSAEHTLLHPFDAFAEPVFLAAVKKEVAKLRAMVASELRRKHGHYSSAERLRNEAMSAAVPPPTLPAGRDWSRSIIAGVHAHPSMNHLHVHVMSEDRVSECMKHRKHYNSFATDFFVPIEDFPLAEDDKRRHPGREGYLQKDLACWRCGKGFGNKFTALKAHLEQEFEAWRIE